MYYLLQLPRDGDVVLLPLADRTAARLERTLLSDDPAIQRAECAEALLRDPFLATWTVCAARVHGHPTPQTIDQGTQWLETATARKLSDALPASCSRVATADVPRYARIAGRILNVRGDCVPEPTPTPVSTDFYWSAVLDHAEEVVARCPRDPWGPRLLPRFVPIVPHDPRDRHHAGCRPDTECRSTDGKSAYAGNPDGGGTPAVRSDGLLNYWFDEVPGIDWRLPALVQRLAKLETVVADFDRRLEEEKLLSLRGLAYGASHEINNPLANISARAQTLMRDESDPDRRRKLKAIHQQAMRAHEMIADLMLFARPPELNCDPCPLADVVTRVVSELADEATARRIDLRLVVADRPILWADSTQLAVALHAVVVNALEAVGSGGSVSVAVQHAGQDGSPAQIRIEDDGPGFSDEVRMHIFDPFFSGREAGRGLGFGLSKCWRIVTSHGGRIDVGQSALGGAVVLISLPLDGVSARAA